MTKTAKPTKANEEERSEVVSKEVLDKISSSVLTSLGKPKDLTKIKTFHLFNQFFRVNVWCGETSGFLHASHLTDSFFVEASPTGDIISTRDGENNILIQKKY